MATLRNSIQKIAAVALCLLLSALLTSCHLIDDLSPDPEEYFTGKSEICPKFSESTTVFSKSGIVEIPDTNNFILTVRNASDGEILYEGKYSDSPEKIPVEEGTYIIRTVSEEFENPDFDSPQWGDEQTIHMPPGESVCVEFVCRQMNCGVRMKIDPEFLTEYPGSVLFLKSLEGKLMYSYSEKRTAYFKPGTISLVMSTGDVDKTLLSRSLLSNEILNLEVNVKSTEGKSPAKSMSIQIDTTRTYLEEEFDLGSDQSDYGPGKGGSSDNAYTIAQAKNNVGQKGVWVAGYIVGGDLTSKNMFFDPPFSSASNLAIGPRSSASSKESCIAVQLPDTEVRKALNLVSHPDNLHRHVCLKGDIVSSYFGITGLKNITDFVIK